MPIPLKCKQCDKNLMPLYTSLTLALVHEQRLARLHAKVKRHFLVNRLTSGN